MKRFLSLVLTLVMVMSLVTVSAGAKDFTDADSITYAEAIDVISTIGVVDGDVDGSFRPTDVLTRQAAAKIICNLILGPTTAAELHADTAPYSDVPTTSQFAGYIAYCAKEGIISGYGNGTFRPGAPLTGYAFMKMLLGALGYDATYEQYVGANWSINVAKQALGIGLNNSLVEEFNGLKSVTREEACLYAFNTLMAATVGYDQRVTTNVNGVDVTISNGAAKVVTWTEGAHTRTDHIKQDGLVQFGEEHFPKLYLDMSIDVFGRPDREWEFDGKEIGVYVNYDLLEEEYTKKVTGKTLYDLLGKSIIDEYDLTVHIDGRTGSKDDVDGMFDKSDLYRANDSKIGKTGNGVLTQVFVNPDRETYGGKEIFVAIINTYLAKATEDYNEKDDELKFDVYSVTNKGTGSKPDYEKAGDLKEVIVADGEDFDIKDITKDEIYLVTIADGEFQSLELPEILDETSVNSFKLESWVKSEGTQYDYADTAMYDEEVLDVYDNTNMKDVTYNIVLDPYGYLIGIELNEDPDQYVFMTGIDANTSNLSVKTADANIIHLDGTMETVTVDMTKSLDGDGNNLWTTLRSATYPKNLSQVNTWCKYSVNSNGVYTLKEVKVSTDATIFTTGTKNKVGQYAQDVSSNVYASDNGSSPVSKTISEKRVSLLSWYKDSDATRGYVYGNDDSIFINVEMKDVNVTDTKGGAARRIIDDVESVTTGVKNVNLVMEDLSNSGVYRAPSAEIYTLYKNDGHVIAAVTIGENQGVSAQYAYIISDDVDQEDLGNTVNNSAKSGSDNGTWTWYREAVVDGEIVHLTEVGDTLSYIGRPDRNQGVMEAGQWYEIKWSADGSVRKAENLQLKFDDVDNYKFITSAEFVEDALAEESTVLLWDRATVANVASGVNVNGLKFVNEAGTLWLDEAQHRGISVSPDVKVVLCLADAKASPFDDNDDKYTGYSGLAQAIRDMNAYNSSHGVQVGEVHISAIMSPSAKVIIINDETPKTTKNPNGGSSSSVTMGNTVLDPVLRTITTDVEYGATVNNVAYAEFVRVLEANGYTINYWFGGLTGTDVPGTNIKRFTIVTDKGPFTADANMYYTVRVNDTIVGKAPTNDGELVAAVTVSGAGTGAVINKTYVSYSVLNTYLEKGDVIANSIAIETGYVPTVTTLDLTDNSIVTAGSYEVNSGRGYVKYGGNVVVTFNAPAQADTTTYTLQVAYEAGKWNNVGELTVNAQASNKLSWTIQNVSREIVSLRIVERRAAKQFTVDAVKLEGIVDSTNNYFNGLTFTVNAEGAVKVTEGYGTQFTLTVTGENTKGSNITLTLSGATGYMEANKATVSGNGTSTITVPTGVGVGDDQTPLQITVYITNVTADCSPVIQLT